MDLNEGLTKIIKEYPDLRRYSTDPDVTRGLINLQMENKRNEFNNFLKEFGESIQKLLPKNYKINCGDIANNGGILHITIFNEDYSNYYLTYLFETNRKWVYLCLGLNLNWVYGSTLYDFRNLATNFRNYVQFINKKDTENIILVNLVRNVIWKVRVGVQKSIEQLIYIANTMSLMKIKIYFYHLKVSLKMI